MKLVYRIKPVHLLIILLTLVSQRYVYNVVFYPLLEWKIGSMHSAVKGEMHAPYRYRVLKPVISEAFNFTLKPLIEDEKERFKIIFKTQLIVLFFFLYYVFYLFLKNFYAELTSIIGLLLLQVSIPLTITDNCWEDGDIINLLLYLLALFFMFKNKDYWIPLIIAVGAFNREQIIFILVFYAVYLWEQKRLFKTKSAIIIISGIVLYCAVYFGIRWYFGYVPNKFTDPVILNVMHWQSGVRLWIEQVLIFVILSVMAYKRSRTFFKLSFLSLIPYTALFFYMGTIGELAKYLPAILIMIIMSLQLFDGKNSAATPADLQQELE
jgi:hypothetical protein